VASVTLGLALVKHTMENLGDSLFVDLDEAALGKGDVAIVSLLWLC